MSKKVIVKHTDAEKFTVSNMLTETEEYVFVVDNSGKVGGYYHDYFEEVK